MNDRCDWVRARLGRLLDAELPDSEKADVEAHCATCAACRAALALLRSADQTVRAAAREPVGGTENEGSDDAFERRWARFQSDHDLAAIERARTLEMQAGAAAPMSGEEVAAAPLGVSEAASLATRIGRTVAGWFAPRPVWRWASLAGGAAVVAVITTVLIARNPEVRGPETLGASRRAAQASVPRSQQVERGGAAGEMPSATIAPQEDARHAAPIDALEEEEEARMVVQGEAAGAVAQDEAAGTIAQDKAAPTVTPEEAAGEMLQVTRADRQSLGAQAAPEPGGITQSAAPELGVVALDAVPQTPKSEITLAPAPEQSREPIPERTWGDLESLYPVPQAMRAGSAGKTSTARQYRTAAEDEPPSRAEVFARLTDLASELDVAGPADLEHADPVEVAGLLTAMERELAEQSPRSQQQSYYATEATEPKTRTRAGKRDVPANATTLGASTEEKDRNAPVAGPYPSTHAPADARARSLATQWVLAGDGWFSLLPAQPSSGSRGRSGDSRAAMRDGARGSHAETRVTDPDSLIAKALSAYERAQALERESELGEGTIPAYVARRIEVLRGWMEGARPPAPAAAPTERGR